MLLKSTVNCCVLPERPYPATQTLVTLGSALLSVLSKHWQMLLHLYTCCAVLSPLLVDDLRATGVPFKLSFTALLPDHAMGAHAGVISCVLFISLCVGACGSGIHRIQLVRRDPQGLKSVGNDAPSVKLLNYLDAQVSKTWSRHAAHAP